MCEVVTDGPTQTQEIGREEKRELFPGENTFDTVFVPVQHVMAERADCLCNGSLNYLPPYLSQAPIHWAKCKQNLAFSYKGNKLFTSNYNKIKSLTMISKIPKTEMFFSSPIIFSDNTNNKFIFYARDASNSLIQYEEGYFPLLGIFVCRR